METIKGKLGIIGGMGPMATDVYYERVINHTVSNSDQDHIFTVISSHTNMPDRTTVIEKNLPHDEVLNAVKFDLDLMEFAKVKTIGIPCNTFHYFYDEVQSMTEIPIINMVEETVKKFVDTIGKKAVVLSTTGTKNAKVYEKYAKIHDLEILELDDEVSEELMKIIYYIKATNDLNPSEFLNLIKDLDEKLKPDGFLISCTELSLLDLKKLDEIKTLDALDVLVYESIVRTGYEYK